MDAAHFEKTLSSEVLFEGRVVTLTKDVALLENGETSIREVVHHHGGACIAKTPLKPPSGSWAKSAA